MTDRAYPRYKGWGAVLPSDTAYQCDGAYLLVHRIGGEGPNGECSRTAGRVASYAEGDSFLCDGHFRVRDEEYRLLGESTSTD